MTYFLLWNNVLISLFHSIPHLLDNIYSNKVIKSLIEVDNIFD